MKLLTKEIERRLPGLHETDDDDDPMVHCRWFTPDSQWTWYVIEYSPQERIAYGLVDGWEQDLGYFSVQELEDLRGPMGLPVERDPHWEPRPLSEVRADIARELEAF